MKPEEQRIAIADACGWERLSMPPGCPDAWEAPAESQFPDATNSMYLPDYLDDLNAMHEAEEVAIRPARLWYQYCLNMPGRSFDESIGATAAQRAEAFLRTLNLWKDEA